jgi:hypothetical protein
MVVLLHGAQSDSAASLTVGPSHDDDRAAACRRRRPARGAAAVHRKGAASASEASLTRGASGGSSWCTRMAPSTCCPGPEPDPSKERLHVATGGLIRRCTASDRRDHPIPCSAVARSAAAPRCSSGCRVAEAPCCRELEMRRPRIAGRQEQSDRGRDQRWPPAGSGADRDASRRPRSRRLTCATESPEAAATSAMLSPRSRRVSRFARWPRGSPGHAPTRGRSDASAFPPDRGVNAALIGQLRPAQARSTARPVRRRDAHPPPFRGPGDRARRDAAQPRPAPASANSSAGG